VQPRGRFRDDQLRAEFLGLRERSRRELLSRDAGGKAVVDQIGREAGEEVAA